MSAPQPLEIVTDPAFENKEDQVEMKPHMPLIENIARYCGSVIELGCGHGNGSTRAIARGMAAGGRHPLELCFISVDIDKARPQIRPNLPYWQVVHGPTEDPLTAAMVLNRMTNRIPDLIFVDTHHTRGQLEAELQVWSVLAGPQTNWLFHDTRVAEAAENPMIEAIREFCKRSRQWVYEEITPVSYGLGRMRQL